MVFIPPSPQVKSDFSHTPHFYRMITPNVVTEIASPLDHSIRQRYVSFYKNFAFSL